VGCKIELELQLPNDSQSRRRHCSSLRNMLSPKLRFHDLSFHAPPSSLRCTHLRSALTRTEHAAADVLQRPNLQQQAAAALLLPALLMNLYIVEPAASFELSAANPVYDGAKLVSSELRPKLSQKIAQFEE
jgi:hypothetical protein